MVKGLCRGVKLDVYFPGFPSLKHIPHCAHLEKRGVRVFQAASRDENVILTVTRDDQEDLAVRVKGHALMSGQGIGLRTTELHAC